MNATKTTSSGLEVQIPKAKGHCSGCWTTSSSQPPFNGQAGAGIEAGTHEAGNEAQKTPHALPATTWSTRAASSPGAASLAPGSPATLRATTPTNHAPPSTFHVSRFTPRVSRFTVQLVLLQLALLAAYLGYRWISSARGWVRTDNAYVAAHIHTVSARVAGTVEEVLVQENQWVSAGSLVARLDARDFEVKRQQALAQAGQAAAQVQQAGALISQARAQVAREQARATKAKLDRERAETLYHGSAGAISRQEFEQASADADAAQAALQSAEAGLESAGAQAGAARAQAQVAQANLQDAELQLSYTEIRAPVAGRIGRKNLEVGNRVQPGQSLLALVQPDVWVTANFKETQLARVKPGQPVQVRLDAFPGRTFQGVVESLSPASGAQFALLPPDNATGNFTRIVQRIPVKVVLSAKAAHDCLDRIVAGMSAIVEVKVRE
jgi:membrane fusion protein (multidrug efflux system)